MKHTNASRRVLVALIALMALPSPALAQSRVPDLAQAALEELMNIEITSASRKEQRAADVAAAVFVITADDIRRSGMTTLPDLLRLAPGVNVAQINANKWAVSVRGFNAMYANKLLVLVDGRSVYNRIFSGVLWDTTDLMLDDIERIEVIRGPGAAIWGANAVNGVINIVTKTAAATQGGLLRADAGGSGAQGAVRYGGALGSGRYRVYSQWSRLNESVFSTGVSANDASHSITSGFRADWTVPSGAFMVDGDFTAGQARALWPNLDSATAAAAPIAQVPTDTRGGHVLARWTRTRPGGGTLQVQSFVDVAARQEPLGDYHRRSFDVDTQYHTALGVRQDMVVGAGYRFIHEGLAGHTGLSMTPAEGDASLLTAFAQDEIQLFQDRLAVTLGAQVQYDSLVGAGLQPTARLIWKARPHQRVWAAVSRALRTPSLSERSIEVDLPPAPGPNGLPSHQLAGQPDGAERDARRRRSRLPRRGATGIGRFARVAPPRAVRAPAGRGGSHASQAGDGQPDRQRGAILSRRGPDRHQRRHEFQGAGRVLVPRRQLHQVPRHAAAGGRESRSERRSRRRRRAQPAMAAALDVRPGAARDGQRIAVSRRPAAAVADRRLHAGGRQRRMAVQPQSGSDPDGPEPLLQRARRIRRHGLAAARHPGAAQCHLPAELVVLMIHFSRLRVAAMAVAMLAAGGRAAAADVASDVAVKAALLFNFAKFADWPLLPAGAPIDVCVAGDDAVAAALVDIVHGQKLNGHALEVVRPRDSTTWQGCEVLFVTAADAKRAGAGLEAIRTLPVLTVGDGKGFADAGGIIETYLENGRMRFAINVDAMERSGLHLSSRLLGLARVIRDNQTPPTTAKDQIHEPR